MIKTVNETINGEDYVITTFDAIKGNLILFKILKYLRGGSSVLDNISLGEGSVLDKEISIGSMLEKIMESIDPAEFNDFIIMLLRSTSYKDKPMSEEVIKHHFAGDYLSMYKLVVAVIKANYFGEGTQSFLDVARQRISQVPSKTELQDTQKS